MTTCSVHAKGMIPVQYIINFAILPSSQGYRLNVKTRLSCKKFTMLRLPNSEGTSIPILQYIASTSFVNLLIETENKIKCMSTAEDPTGLVKGALSHVVDQYYSSKLKLDPIFKDQEVSTSFRKLGNDLYERANDMYQANTLYSLATIKFPILSCSTSF
jgi:hypothetical protein